MKHKRKVINWNTIRKLSFTVCMCICSLSLFAQQSITGVVTDEKNEPMPGTSVLILGTTQGVTADVNGKFSISVPSGDAVLRFSFVGYVTQDITVGKRTNIRVTMHERLELDEVVVVGYGTQKKVNLTGAISSIKSDAIQSTTATAVAQKLQGKVAGLNIRTNSGEPGQFDNVINIRGFGEPLYVIDGIIRPAADFQRLNGEDIESITVLKDATAAIYGMNASNGVIIVTTKLGTQGKTKFHFSANSGWATPTEMPKMANAYEFLTLRNEANTNYGQSPYISKEELEKWRVGGPGYESTDWAAETFHKYSHRQEYSLSAEGGSDKVSYYINLNGMIDNGIYKTDDLYYKKLSFRSNISAQLTNNIKAIFNIAGYFDKQEYPSYGVWNVVRGTATSLPTHSVYANGNPQYLNRVQDGGGVNPVAISSSDLTGYGRNNNDNYQTSLELRYNVPFVKGLELKGMGAFDKSFWQYKGLNLELPLYDYDVETDAYNATYFHSPQSIQNNFANRYFLTLRGQADYKTSIQGNHNIAATLVYEQRETFSRNAMILKYYDFYTNDQISQASNTNAQSDGNEETTRAMSYIGRLNYDYKGKYLIEFSGRYDGSYRYHPNKRWGLFPVVSGGWRISEESFMKGLPFLSNLKIRGSYGKIGQDTGAPFQYLPGFTTGGGWYEFSDGSTTLGLNTPALVNEHLTWMTNTITDIGFDIDLFNNKLSLTFDYFDKLREGLLTRRNVSLPNTYGGTFPEENLNKDRVRGFEVSINHQNTIGDLHYNVAGNITYSQFRHVYVEQAPFTDSWDYYRSATVGRNSGIVWTYNVIGQYKSMEEIQNAPVRQGTLGNQYMLPGDYIYEDINGDNVIDGNDAVPKFFDNTPRLNYGLTLSASWRGFDFNALFQGAALFSQAFDGMYVKYFYEDANIPARYMDRWHQADPYDPSSEWIAGKYPAMRMINNADNSALYAASSAWRKDCSYLRLKNLEIGYTFNQPIIKRVGIDNLRLFVSGSNLYTWCDEFIKAFDPERIAGSYSTGWVYPLQKTYNVGLSINF